MNSLAGYYAAVVNALAKGRLVPFLGAGVNRCDRPPGFGKWEPGQYQFLPDGSELAGHLSTSFGGPADISDLARVSQFVSVISGYPALREELHSIFDGDYPATSAHRLVAGLPQRLREKGYSRRCPLIFSTNYDDVLERALAKQGEEFDLLTYQTRGKHQGRFLHTPFGKEPRPVPVPNTYNELPLDRRVVILKMHGAVDRTDGDSDSFVITEDHYIDYLSRTDLSSFLPATIKAKLNKAQFLFLGYGLRDWNMRVILHRIVMERGETSGRGQEEEAPKSWAILLHPDQLECEFWKARHVHLIDIPLEDFVTGVEARLEVLPPNPARTSPEAARA